MGSPLLSLHIEPPRSLWQALCRRSDPAGDAAVDTAVAAILADVASRGDEAVRECSRRFDGYTGPLRLDPEAAARAAACASPALTEAIARAWAQILDFHRRQTPAGVVEAELTPGVRCRQVWLPLRRVGLYVPGGRAPLVSTVLMLCAPARAAGCREIALFTPAAGDAGVNPGVLAAAAVCGVTEIYAVGGAQAVAAMAYGTESIARVDKIFGPGNRYVMRAKQMVTERVAIDMPAGPSEVMVMADATASPAFVAADLLSQAEHGPDSQCMLVASTADVARAVEAELERQLATLPRRDTALQALACSRAVVLADAGARIAFAEAYAPEHLVIQTADPEAVASAITAAGSVFVGPWACESAGDYASGTNHTLPTSGWARSASALGTADFMRRMTLQSLTREGLEALAPVITTLARAEGLEAHARAAEIRTTTSH